MRSIQGSGNDNYGFTLDFFVLAMDKNSTERIPDQFFVHFCYFPTPVYLALTENFKTVLKKCLDTVRGFKKNQWTFVLAQRVQKVLSLFFAGRGKSEKDKRLVLDT